MGGQTMILASLFLLPLPTYRAVTNWCFVFFFSSSLSPIIVTFPHFFFHFFFFRTWEYLIVMRRFDFFEYDSRMWRWHSGYKLIIFSVTLPILCLCFFSYSWFQTINYGEKKKSKPLISCWCHKRKQFFFFNLAYILAALYCFWQKMINVIELLKFESSFV